jgi:hypothetical protein
VSGERVGLTIINPQASTAMWRLHPVTGSPCMDAARAADLDGLRALTVGIARHRAEPTRHTPAPP